MTLHERRWTRIGSAVVALAGVAVAVPARADDDRAAVTRQNLIDEAKRARERGDHKEAFALAKKALALKAHPSLQQMAAGEALEIKAWGDAYVIASACLIAVRRDDTLKDRKKITDRCQAIVQKTEGLIGRIVLQVKDPPDGLRVKLAGDEIKAAELGAPLPVTPGALTVEASASGYLPFREEVRVGEGDSKEVAIVLLPKPEPVVTPTPTPSPLPGMVPQPAPAQFGGRATTGGAAVRWDDTWVGVYQCPAGVARAEKVSVTQRGRTLVGTKVTGDECVPAGTVSFQGALPRDGLTAADLPVVLSVRITIGQPGGRRSLVAGRLTIDSPGHMTLAGAESVELTRAGSEGAAPPVAAAPMPIPAAGRQTYRQATVVNQPPPPSTSAAPGMPQVALITSRVVGANQLDTTARQAAAFTQLAWIVRALSEGGEFGNRMTRDEQTLVRTYTNAARNADRAGQTLLARSGFGRGGREPAASAWSRTRQAYDNEKYRIWLLDFCSPQVKQMYLSRKR